jgi:hypothetical protein
VKYLLKKAMKKQQWRLNNIFIAAQLFYCVMQ